MHYNGYYDRIDAAAAEEEDEARYLNTIPSLSSSSAAHMR